MYAVTPIGWVRSERQKLSEKGWDLVSSHIELDTSRFDASSLAGIQTFSHVEIIFFFHKVPENRIELHARRPQNNPDWPEMGIFAQRGKNRPNRIGATICNLLWVDGTDLHISGLDAIDGTPVLDIKPVMKGFLPKGPVDEPEWASELMKTYW